MTSTLFKRLAEHIKSFPARIKPALSQLLQLGEFSWQRLCQIHEELDEREQATPDESDPKIQEIKIQPLSAQLIAEKWVENSVSAKNTSLQRSSSELSDTSSARKNNNNLKNNANADFTLQSFITPAAADMISEHGMAETAIRAKQDFTPLPLSSKHLTTNAIPKNFTEAKPIETQAGNTLPLSTRNNETAILSTGLPAKKYARQMLIQPAIKESLFSSHVLKKITSQPTHAAGYQQIPAPRTIKITIDRIKIQSKTQKTSIEKNQLKQSNANAVKSISLIDYLHKYSRSS